MDEPLARRLRRARILAVALALASIAGCAAEPRAPVRATWVFGADAPGFDPGGPPDSRRWAIERSLSFGLVEADSNGAPVPAAAAAIEISPDSLTYTFRLRDGLEFTDGSSCRSADFAAALTASLGRGDHATRSWQLAAVEGVDGVRAGRALPPLGIDTPDGRTLVLRLAVRDADLLRKLALPGTSSPWKRAREAPASGWVGAVGIGPMRVIAGDTTRRLVMVPARPAPGAPVDTLVIRFLPGLTRVRSLLREGDVDLVWPMPPGLLAEPIPESYRVTRGPSRPARRLVLVQRADLPPTTRLPARAALAHGINYEEIVRALGREGSQVRAWFPNGGPYENPRLDPAEIELWRERGRLGRSFHVDMSYDDRGPAGGVARVMQGEWARNDIYVQLQPLRGGNQAREALAGRSHLALVEWRDLTETPSGMLAQLVAPLRGPAVGAVRTGWRTREFDRWILPRVMVDPFDPVAAGRRLQEERIVLPLADLAWVWIERAGGPAAPFDPGLGPTCPGPPGAFDRRVGGAR